MNTETNNIEPMPADLNIQKATFETTHSRLLIMHDDIANVMNAQSTILQAVSYVIALVGSDEKDAEFIESLRNLAEISRKRSKAINDAVDRDFKILKGEDNDSNPPQDIL